MTTSLISSMQEFRELCNAAVTGPLEFRCSDCNKLLAKSNRFSELAAEIKCTRCGVMNEI